MFKKYSVLASDQKTLRAVRAIVFGSTVEGRRMVNDFGCVR